MQHIVKDPQGTEHVINAPDDATPEQVMAMAPQIVAQATQGLSNAPQAPQEQGFVQGVGNALANRNAQANTIKQAYNNGEQGLAESAFQGVGKVGAGLMNDVAGEALKSVGNGISSITPDFVAQPVKQAASGVSNYLANSPLGALAHSAVQGYGQFEQNHPRAARNIEAATNLGALVGSAAPVKSAAVAGADVAKQAAVDAGGKTVNAITDVVKSVKGRALTTAKNEPVRPASKDYWDELDKINGGLPSSQVEKTSLKINSLRPKDPALAAIWDESGVHESVRTVNNALASGSLTYKGAQALRADVNSKLKMAYRAGDETKGRYLMQMKETLTDALTNPEATSEMDVKASNAWKMANHESAKEFLLDDLELVAAKAAGKAQPANSLDTAVNNFLNGNASAGLREDERAALKDVTKKTNTGELLKSGGTRLMSVAGATIGGPAGFLVGHYGSMLNRTTAEGLKLKKLDRVYDLIKNRPSPELSEHKAPLQLTNQRRSTLERNIKQRKAYEDSKSLSNPLMQLGEDKQKLLPSPENMTPLSALTARKSGEPMSDWQVKQAKRAMETTGKAVPETPAIKPPASQSLKLDEASLTTSRRTQLNNLRAKLLNGEISQNKFTETASKSFDLNLTQARSLAREILKYSKK